MPISSAPPTAPSTSGRFTAGLKIPMRDGIRLHAYACGPRDSDVPRPVVFRLTPYLADSFHADGAYFAARDYVYVCADVRGRGDSEGAEYRQAVYDADDGCDCIEWLARQPWCDGRVVTYGSSYSGTNQWLIAARRPPALRAIAPSGVSLVGYDYPSPGGALPGSILQVLTLTAGRSLYPNAAADAETWNALYADLWQRHGRFAELPGRIGVDAPQFAALARGEPLAACFPGCELRPADYAAVDVPAFSVTGVADITCAGTLEAHRRFLAAAREPVTHRSRLLVGPWDHLGLESGSDRVGDLSFGPQARFDVRALKVDWFDWVLGRAPLPARLEQPFTWYLAGAEEWRGGASIDAVARGRRRLHLASGGDAREIYRCGTLAEEPSAGAPDAFTCDPADFEAVRMELLPRDVPPPVKEHAPTLRVGRVYTDLGGVLAGADPTNDAFVAELDGRGVVYQTAPLATDLDVVGHPAASLWLAVDAPDADLALLLSYVVPGRTSQVALSSDFVRLRHRHGLDREDLLTPGEPFLLERRCLWLVARRVPRGARLRLVIRSGASLRREKNLNSATPVHRQAPHEARAARVTVLHSAQHPSWLELPLEGAPSR